MAGACRRSSPVGLWLSVALAIAGLTTFYMLGAGNLVLTEPDEARCALIARHMVQSGDWLAPQLLDQPYFNKPPLYFWIIACSIKLFGAGEWALRLPSALIMAATVALTGLLTAQLFGRRAGWLAGATFAVSVAGLMAARVVRMDMLLALWVTAALVCWARAYMVPDREEAPSDDSTAPCELPNSRGAGCGCRVSGNSSNSRARSRSHATTTRSGPCGLPRQARDRQWHPADRRRHAPATAQEHGTRSSASSGVRMAANGAAMAPAQRASSRRPRHPTAWYVAMYVCMGLGCLTKGPVAVVLPGLIIGVCVLLSRRWRDLLRMHIPLGAVIVLAMFGGWAGYMTWRYPEYLREFFWGQNLDRFAGSGVDAVTSRFTVAGAFVGGVMPWAVLVALAGWHLRPRRTMSAGEIFLWVWGLTVLVFFSLSKGQLANYVLPALPSTFALLGAYLARADEKRRGFAVALAATFVLAAAALVAWPVVERVRFGDPHYGLAALRLGGLAGLAGLTWYLWRRGPVRALLPFLAGVVIFGVELPYGAGRAYFATRSCAGLAESFQKLEPTSDPVIVTTEVRYGLAYYLPAWRFHLVTERELRELLPLLKAERPVYAVVTGDKILDLLTGRRDMRIEIDGQALDLKDRLTVVAEERGDYLVRVAPAGTEVRSQ